MTAARPAPATGRRRSVLVALAFVASLAGAGCKSSPFDGPQVLGGRTVEPAVLERGLGVYKRLCVGCHGERGDGQGDAGAVLVPPPRDFRLGVFKYHSTPEGRLPTDDDLRRVIRQGLRGTSMAPVTGLSDGDLDAVVQYVKTFSPRWRKEEPGPPLPVPPDPWSGRTAEARRRGLELYHGEAGCWTCHPAYVSAAELESLRRISQRDSEINRTVDIRNRGDIHRPRPVNSAFGKVLPTDFLDGTLRAVNTELDLFRIISAGIGGSSMPGWHDSLSSKDFSDALSEDIWAVTHYVWHLSRARGTPEAKAIRKRASRADDTAPREPAPPAKNNKG